MALKAIMSLFILFLGLLRCTATRINNNPIAYIGKSQIVGQRVQQSSLEANQFLAVPYAEPPIGDLRFMKPEPLSCYPTVLNAFHPPPACHQYATEPFPWYANTADKSEDCLYLNIWTPTDASSSNTKAVIYWMYGGSFRMGSIRQDLYDGIALAVLGDIVVVTVNYRVGAFGFLTSNTEDAPGNAGFWDVLEGLRWVNKNIQAFGGDRSRITIAGESAGSMFTGMLSVSPLSRGLYARQIMESGSPSWFAFDNSTKSVMMSQYAGSLVGCSNDTYTIYEHPKEVIHCLKGVDAVTLAKLDSKLFTESTVTFSPQYGDEILPTNPRLDIAKGEFHGTELLIGVNRNEGSQLSTNFKEIFGFYGEKEPHMNKTAAKHMLGRLLESFPKPEVLVDYYLNDSIPEYAFEEIQSQVFAAFGDELLMCPTVFHAEKMAEKGKDVYFYFWVHRPSTTIWHPRLGVAHFSEVQFVFGQPVLHPKRYQQDKVQISHQIIEEWTHFVKYGKPSTPWLLYSKPFPIFKYLGPGTETQNYGMGPFRQNCDVMRPYFGF